MSSSIDACSYSDDNDVPDKCPKSPNGEHKYEITCGSWPSCEMTCKHCGDVFYTK
jgi:hypothetical protein